MALSANFRLMCWDCAVAWGMDLLLHRGISEMSLRSALIEKASPAYVLLNRTGKNIEAVLAAKIGPMATTHTPPPQTHFEGRRGFMIGNSRMKPIWKKYTQHGTRTAFPPFCWQMFPPPIQISHMDAHNATCGEEILTWRCPAGLYHSLSTTTLSWKKSQNK